MVLGLFLVFLTRNGWGRISAFRAKSKIVLLGFSAAILTAAGYIGDLFLEFSRGSYPHWADSLSIPLAGVPILFFIFTSWAAIHMLGLMGKFVTGATISGLRFRKINWWHGVLAIATALIVILFIYDGCFFYSFALIVGKRAYTTIVLLAHKCITDV